jgi:hypothetical protein
MPKSTTPKLNDTQLILLSSASQREDGLAVLPESLKASAAKAAVTKLLGLGFLKEVRVKRDQPSWRTDEEERPLGLKLTKAGAAAIQVDEETAPEPAQPKRSGRTESDATEPRAGSKKALVLSLLTRPKGATIDDLLSATGWLPHTTRAALTRLRQEGHEFVKSKNADGETVYRAETHPKPRGVKLAG